MSNRCLKCNIERHTPLSESCPLCGFSTRPRRVHTRSGYVRSKPRVAGATREQRKQQSEQARAERDARRIQNISIKEQA